MPNEARQAHGDERRATDPREHLKVQMRRHGLSAPDLAKEFGVHPQSLYNVTSGTRKVSSKLALKLSAKFGEPIEYWLGEQTSPPARGSVNDGGTRSDPSSSDGELGVEDAKLPADILVDNELRELAGRVGSGLVIEPFIDANVSPASHDLTVGLVVTKGFSTLDKYGWGLIVRHECDPESLLDDQLEEARSLIDEYEDDIEFHRSHPLGEREAVGIVAREQLRFSRDFLARAGGVTRNARRGLMLGHGLQVDPGYSGPILFTAFNIGLEPIELELGQKIMSLEIIRLKRSPEVPYHENTNSRISRIVERLSAEISALFDYDEIASEKRCVATLRGSPDETFVSDGAIEEVRSRAVTRVVESCARGDSTDPFMLPFTRALGLVTIDEEDADALIRRFPGRSPAVRERTKASFINGSERRTVKETLKRLDLDAGPAIAKLMGIRADEHGAGT